MIRFFNPTILSFLTTCGALSNAYKNSNNNTDNAVTQNQM